MDKYEYKLRSDEIKALIAKGEYGEAAVLADTIDWRRVKSVMMLCTISDLYKINRRFEDARDMLLLAYDRHPGGRSIVYSLCELSIKMDDFVAAVEYYKEFVQAAPKDTGRYVLQYKLYEAQDVSLEERIEVLEVLKARDPIEKWVYELAYLYHRVGLATRCVEECDEIIAMFGKGKYVIKAMELKMLHEPLTPEQQGSYDRMRFGTGKASEPEQEKVPEQEPVQQEDILDAPTKEIPGQEVDIQVKLMKVGQYDTINMQKELAENMKELMGGQPDEGRPENAVEAPSESDESGVEAEESEKTEYTDEVEAAKDNNSAGEENPDILPDALNMDTGILDLPDDEPEDELVEPEETKVEEVFFGETGEIDTTSTKILEEMKQEALGKKEAPAEETAPVPEEPPVQEAPAAAPVMQEVIDWRAAFKTTGFDKLLGMEYDGQISMVVPDLEKVEKQITGQISLEDVLVEWEKMKKDSEQRRMEAVRQRVIEQTGEMFTEFDEAVRDGLLEQLENSDVLPEEVDEVEELEEIEENLPEEETSEEELPDEEFAGEEASDEEETAGAEAETEEETAEEEKAEAEAETEEEAAEEEKAEAEAETEEEAAEEEKAEEAETKEEEEEAAKEKTAEEETKEPEEPTKEKAKEKTRPLSPEERQQFGAYIQSKATKEQIIYALDHISMAAYTGNVIITGEEGMDILSLAKSLIQEVKQTDSNFSGKIAKISGDSLNRRGVGPTLGRLKNGALIIQEAGKLNQETIEQIHKGLDQDVDGIIVILEDTKRTVQKLLKKYPFLTERFTIQIHVDAMDNDSLVAYAKKYAQEQEYSIDELGVLALHTCIADRQTSDHSVTVAEVREIMDGAIRNANKKTVGHFFDILLAKRYDEEDMIILREKDFI